MDRNFQKLANEIIQQVEARVKTHLDQFEARAEKRMQMHFESMEVRMQMHFENMEGTVRLAAEGYGATLESINRRLTELDEKAVSAFSSRPSSSPSPAP